MKENEFITTRERIYHAEVRGDVIYDADFASVERTEDRIIIQMRLDMLQNWLQLCDQMWCAMFCLSEWARKKMKEDKNMKFADIKPILTLERYQESSEEVSIDGDVNFFYYFHSDNNWVMYENENEYLFLYEMEIKDHYDMGIDSQIEALSFFPSDHMGGISDFLHSWFYRVNGYPAEEVMDDAARNET